MEDITKAYVFLMNSYELGDFIYLFGFSRGAYTVRALAALLHMFGLIREGNESLVPYAVQFFRSRVHTHHSFEVAQAFKETFSIACKPHFLGVWDTVSSVGWIYDPLKLPYTAHNPDISILRHAISIDERRCAFRENLWQAEPTQDSKQVWFAGYHSDVGGSFAVGQKGLPDIALGWMLREATRAGLWIKTQNPQPATGAENGPDDACAPMHNSMTLAWLPLEVLPRRFWDRRCSPPLYRWRIPLCSPRYMAEDSAVHWCRAASAEDGISSAEPTEEIRHRTLKDISGEYDQPGA